MPIAPSNRNTPDNKPMILWIIHATFVQVTIVYSLVFEFVLKQERSGQVMIPGLSPMVCLIFILIAAAVFFFAVVFMRPIFEKQTQGVGATDYIARRQIDMIIHDVMYETIAVLGLMGGIVQGFASWQVHAATAIALLLLLSQLGWIRSVIDEYKRRSSLEKGISS